MKFHTKTKIRKVLAAGLFVLLMTFALSGCEPEVIVTFDAPEEGQVVTEEPDLGGLAALAEDPATWRGVVILLLPFLGMFLGQAGFTKQVNTMIVFGLAMVASAADIILIEGQIPTPTNAVTIVTSTLAYSYTLYAMLREMGLADWLTRLTTLRRFSKQPIGEANMASPYDTRPV